MLLQCLPSSFGSIPPTVWEEMSFEVFQDGHHGGHLGYEKTILAILSLYNSPKPPIKFQLNLTYCLGLDVVWRISISERNVLGILNLCVTVMLIVKFWLNPTFGFGGDVVWRISRWWPWRPSWISERNNLSSSESPCHSDASHRVSAQSDLWFWMRYRLKNFKTAILDIGMERFLQFWISVSLWSFPSSFRSIQLTAWEEMSFEEFQDGRPDIGTD